MKIAFMGSPKFAAEVLAGILDQHEIVCVVTQPDAPVGRGHQMQFNPVKQLAMEHHIPVLQPKKISLDVQPLIAYCPDIIVTCAFGQILRQNVLDAAPHGVINVHGSLLPKYRGAAPIQWAIINGETTTGVTIAQTELGLDCGPIITSLPLVIDPEDTAGDLFNKMTAVGIRALLTALTQIENGTATFTPQDHAAASNAPMLNKTMAKIDWQQDAVTIANLIRGLNPWPVAYFDLSGTPIKVYRATVLSGSATPGMVVQANARDGLIIGCGNNLLKIELLQVPGKKMITGNDFCNGRNLTAMKLD